MKLTQNVGTPDRIIRLLIGAALSAAVVAGVVTAPLAWVAGALAAIMLVTGATGFCPLYALFGIRSCPIQRT
ncbi:MAG: hypothetical protein A2V85_16710 [Chloroflexi bacterium RBG_16_72_14]|nr:MAG: hypothetical protein A2V85_16710 [Chloroflexi bacterium RBG_16_72_14]